MVAEAEASRRWAEFRLAVIGHLVVRDVERGQLASGLKSLSATKWKHPVSGRPVTFSYSTIERWYYIGLKNAAGPLGELSRRRCDAGLHRSLTKQVCHYLARQAKRHSSWSYCRHHKTLVQYMKEHEWGLPPGYSTVRRYLHSLSSSQNVTVDAEIKRLDDLVVHLRRTLIVQSTQNHLLRVPELRAKAFGPPFKFARFRPSEKVYVLSRLKDYKSAGGSQSEFCSGVGISKATIERWGASYRRHGEPGLCARTRRKFPNRTRARETKARILEIFHSQPRTYGINRASWTGESLAKALYSKFRVTISGSTAIRHLRESGYTMRRARQVLTSSDPDYQAKVEVLLQILRTLGITERLFFVDELGPLAVKKHGGSSFVKKAETLVVPQLQTPKCSIVLAGALSATTNQMTWCYVQSKDTMAMIDLIELLFSEHQDKTHLYICWDAASWHDSIPLIGWLDAFNLKTTETKEGPLITLVPLPSCSQFLNVIESVFGVMKKAVIHHSDYQSAHQMKSAISQHFRERNAHFKDNPRRAGKKIWETDFFRDAGSLPSGNYRDY
ncbi:MAG TPA: IS630 family transposase [Terriglobales bacterium]|nr:IS630 family transposase [Terriglobales bacterium]